jgi:hypothetical protein
MLSKSAVVVSAAVFVTGLLLGAALRPVAAVGAQQGPRVFEIRTYTAEAGKLDALHARFREHTTKLFEKHGMTNIGYWSPQDPPWSQNTLIYVLAHSSRDAAKKSWEAFRSDPVWLKARTESEAQGRIVTNVESVFLSPTDYSPLR